MYSGNKEQRMRGPFRLTVMVLEIIKQLELSYLAVNQPSRQTQIIQTQGVSRPTNPSECQTLLLAGAFHLNPFQLVFISPTGPFILRPHLWVSVEEWFQKSGSSRSDFFFWSTTFPQSEKMWIYSIKPPFYLFNHFSRTRFLEPDFSNHFSTTFQKSGCRINGLQGPKTGPIGSGSRAP